MSHSETPSDARQPMGLIAEMEATNALGRALGAHLTPGVARVELEFTSAGPVDQLILRTIGLDGEKNSPRDIDDASDAVEELRAAMYRDGTGTWFSARIVLTSDRSFDADYNYDELPPTAFEFSPSAFAADLEQYPRDDEHVPAWLREKLDEAARA